MASRGISIVTGANSGVGLEVATDLFRRGFTVIMACRNIARAERAKDHILSTEDPPVFSDDLVAAAEETANRRRRLQVMSLDLSSLQSVREFHTAFEVLLDVSLQRKLSVHVLPNQF